MSDGTDTAKVNLAGNYVLANFTLSTDGSGGTLVIDPPPSTTPIAAATTGIAIEHARLYREAEVASITDDLTGLGNTRRFNRLLPELLATGAPLSLIVLDLDNFKAVVDTHGHLVGSRTLAYVGHLIAGAIRPGDHAARFGGDEFVVILPHTDPGGGAVVAERIRAAIADARILPSDGVDISAVTAQRRRRQLSRGRHDVGGALQAGGHGDVCRKAPRQERRRRGVAQRYPSPSWEDGTRHSQRWERSTVRTDTPDGIGPATLVCPFPKPPRSTATRPRPGSRTTPRR